MSRKGVGNRACYTVKPELPTHLVQELNAGTVVRAYSRTIGQVNKTQFNISVEMAYLCKRMHHFRPNYAPFKFTSICQIRIVFLQ